MNSETGYPVDVCSPAAAWQALSADAGAQMIDVRTRAEWGFVGVPDLTGLDKSVVLAEWRAYPNMEVAPNFASRVLEGFGTNMPSHVLFICRSGARSMEAAEAVAELSSSRGLDIRCTNVAEGFEGDLNGDRHRGALNGWKAHGLPWTQS